MEDEQYCRSGSDDGQDGQDRYELHRTACSDFIVNVTIPFYCISSDVSGSSDVGDIGHAFCCTARDRYEDDVRTICKTSIIFIYKKNSRYITDNI